MIRAPSAAVYPVTVDEINKRAKDVNDADLGEIEQLKTLIDNPPFPFTSDDIREKLADAELFQEDNVTESLDHQVRNADAELARIRQWREADQQGVGLDGRPDELRLWHAKLGVQGVEMRACEAQLLDLKKQLADARPRYTGFGLREIKRDTRAVRPRMTISEVDGQVYSIVANLYGRAPRRISDASGDCGRDERQHAGQVRGLGDNPHRGDPGGAGQLP